MIHVLKKKILLVSNAFYPEISPRSSRATELAKEFIRQGHEVTVWSKYRDYNYSSFLIEYPLIFRMWTRPKLPEIQDYSFKPFTIISRTLRRILLLLFEYPGIEEMFIVKKVLKGENGYDLLISFAVPFPIHWGVSLIRTKTHLIARKWVADCGDPYMFSRLDTFRKPFYFRFLEQRFCRKCNYISVPFEKLRNQFYPRFKSKIVTIPQGFNFKEVKAFKGPVNNPIPVFVFSGTIIPRKRDLSFFLDFLATLKMDFLFIVYTQQLRWFAKYKTKLGDKLQLREYIDRISLIYEISKADFSVNVDTVYDSDSNIEAIPSKLIDYALSGRPILTINSGSLDKDLVMAFLNKDYSRQRVVDVSKFNISQVADKFLELSI